MRPTAAFYLIRVEGGGCGGVLQSFPHLSVHAHASDTTLTGFLDQGALYGIVAYLVTLGLTLVDLRLTEPADSSRASLNLVPAENFVRAGQRCVREACGCLVDGTGMMASCADASGLSGGHERLRRAETAADE